MRINYGRSIEELKQIAIDSIKDNAKSKIESIYPLWKQSNINAKSIDILSKSEKTPKDKDILTEFSKIRLWIDSIRELTNVAEQTIEAATSPKEIREIKDLVIASIFEKRKPV